MKRSISIIATIMFIFLIAVSAIVTVAVGIKEGLIFMLVGAAVFLIYAMVLLF